MNSPAAWRSVTGPAEWEAFVATCRMNYDFDPEADAELIAASHLGSRDGGWRVVWNRFADAPASYPGIQDLLHRARPTADLFLEPSSWPQDNELAEDGLRLALLGLDSKTQEEAPDVIL
jgi:hypothetical protein